MDLKSFTGGIAFSVLGVLVCIGSFSLGLGRLGKPGPGLMFLFAGSLAVLLSIVDIIKGLSSKGSGIKKFLSLWQGLYWKRAGILFIGTLIYVVVLGTMGFLISTLFYSGFCMKSIGVQKWLVLVGTSIFSTLIFYLLIHFLHVPILLFPNFLGL